MARLALIFALLSAVILPGVATAAAPPAQTPPTLMPDATTLTLKSAGSGKGWTVRLGVTNLTAAATTATVGSGIPNCTLSVGESKDANGKAPVTFPVPAAGRAEATVHVSSLCKPAATKDGFAFLVVSGTGGYDAVRAVPSDGDSSGLSAIWIVLIVLVGLALAGVLVWAVMARRPVRRDAPGVRPV